MAQTVILSLIVAVILTVVIFVLGRKKLSPAPIVGSCSAAIAASCHSTSSEHIDELYGRGTCYIVVCYGTEGAYGDGKQAKPKQAR